MLEATVVHRTAVRLVVVDEAGAVLLLHYRTPDTAEDFWCTPGGAVATGETHAQAARRELREETGWDGDIELGEPVWAREHVFRIGDGRLFHQHEVYHGLRLPHFEPHAVDLSEFEAQAITGMRWWSLDDLVTTGETLQPPELPTLMTRLLPPRGSTGR